MSEQRRRRRIPTEPEGILPVSPSFTPEPMQDEDQTYIPYQPQADVPPRASYQPPRSTYQPPRSEPRAPQYAPTRPAPAQPAPAPTQTVIVNQVNTSASSSFGDQSYFDAGLLSLIGHSILASLLVIFTFGIGVPFAICIFYRWEARHTVINGRRLRFDGTGWQLLGKWIIWMLLTIITLGIYSFWLGIKLQQWRIQHTHFA